ncbi:hypothetical protein F5884DRAFT_667289 [Xylogone sp. PMI_703]|nr:hypothetical protein F5884DRAFT_667289 [Xylogone sp. PMI_703]
MGWFDGKSEVGSTHSHHHHRHNSTGSIHREKRRSTSASVIFPSSGDKHRSRSSSAIYGTGDKHTKSTSSFFGLGAGNNASKSSSYYKRSPRNGYIKKLYAQLQHLLRKLLRYLKKHPFRVFMLVIVPLITGGALTAMLARFGLRLPPSIERALGGKPPSRRTTTIGHDRNGNLRFERSGGSMETVVSGVVNVAKAFV